jgi:hypothetical protein
MLKSPSKIQLVLRIFLFLLVSSVSVRATELLRDHHPKNDYVFEVDPSEIPATIEGGQTTARAIEWAARFYGELLAVEGCEFRAKPTRFWLITFAGPRGSEKVYAVVLPDGSIVEPRILIRS